MSGRVRFLSRCVEGCEECIKVISEMCQGMSGVCIEEV